MSYTPPQFKDFGKGLNDLFKKQFDYANTVTVKRTTATGLKIETVGKQVVKDSKTSLGGSVKLSYKEKGLGEFEASNDTAGNLKGKAKFTSLADGVVATLETNLNSKFKASGQVDYTQDHFASSAKVQLAEGKDAHVTSGAVSGVVGYEGISLGASLAFSNASGSFGAPDVQMGFNFAENDFQFSLNTENAKGTPVVRAKLFQQVNATLQSGFQFDSDNTVTVGFQNKLDKDTILKTKISTSGVIDTAIKYTLANPSAQINVATQFKTTNGLDWNASKYGVGITLGDF